MTDDKLAICCETDIEFKAVTAQFESAVEGRDGIFGGLAGQA
jgi:hypothetical protein